MKHWKTRLFSLIALTTMGVGCGKVVAESYYIATDNFVAPAILTSDNDLVIDTKLKLSQVLLEKGRATQALDEANADLQAGELAVARLNELKEFASNALAWTKTTTGAQANMGAADLRTIAAQKTQLVEMINRQTALVNDAQKNLSAGLIQRPDYDKELQTLDQVKIALFENERSRMASELLFNQAALGQQSLGRQRSAMPMPEQVMSMDQLVRVEVELLQVQAEMRAKTSERNIVQEELDKIDQLEKELRARPIFQAIDRNVSVAFMPYTQMKGVVPGSSVMDCVWGVFNCKKVGTVANIIPGETILPDIFLGGQTRGQLIELNVHNDEAMQSKILRVRDSSAPSFVALTKK